MSLKIITFVIISVLFVIASAQKKKSIFCFYEIKDDNLDQYIESKLTHCTHLLIRPGKIVDNKLVYPEHDELIRKIKKLYPTMFVLLTIGGESDPVLNDVNNKYMKLLPSNSITRSPKPKLRGTKQPTEDVYSDNSIQLEFIRSIGNPINHYYDGINLAWNFPTVFSQYSTNAGNYYFKIIKNYFIPQRTDTNMFTDFLKSLKKYAADNDDFLVTFTVNPNVNLPNCSLPKKIYLETQTDGTREEEIYTSRKNTDQYFQPKDVSVLVDFVILQAFDFYTPGIFPNEAYFPSALNGFSDENLYANADYVVQYWLNQGVEPGKLILGIPTYGRAWAMNDIYTDLGISPCKVNGKYSHFPDKVSPYSIDDSLTIIRDPVHNLGTYGLRFPTPEEPEGVWVGFEEPDTASKKAEYVITKALGGVAIDDIAIDTGILKTVYKVLNGKI